jgi:hypothetical protein
MISDNVREAVAKMFGGKPWHHIRRFEWFGNIDGTKVAVVVATMKGDFTNYALGKDGRDRVYDAVKDGKVDVGFLVLAKVDTVGAYTFVDAFNIVEVYDKIERLPTRTSEYGPYWLLSPVLAASRFEPEKVPF